MAKLLKVTNGEVTEEFPITRAELKIGRASDNDIILHDDTVSSHHAIISVVAVSSESGLVQEFQIQDLKSTNKTYVNNKEVNEQKLRDKDVVRIGLSHFEFDGDNHGDMQKEFQRTTKLHKSWIPGVFYTKD
ncbi:MAG: FHA domain-containing protein [Gammaproteobacteria bacterium]|jgi:pSer/pThr/pTyr-binding forkhead associated (FHA) protein